MNNLNSVNLGRTALFKAFEEERQEWLAAGMSEADIFRVHYGELDEDGRLLRPKDGGYASDYFVWLDERRHTRADHKYSPGAPVAIDAVDPDGAWISDGRSGLDDAEFDIDLAAALAKLTELQRFCFVEVCLNGETETSVAVRLKISQQMVDKHIRAAKKKLQKFFQG